MYIHVMTSHHQPSRVVRILSPLLPATNVSNIATRTHSAPDLADSRLLIDWLPCRDGVNDDGRASVVPGPLSHMMRLNIATTSAGRRDNHPSIQGYDIVFLS